MDASGAHRPPRADGGTPPERKGTPRPPGEGRRKRPAESRYAGWGDGIDREFCARAEHFIPATFPVASHSGAATIGAAVVARRPGAYLLCSFSHCGAHVWPDGDVMHDTRDEASVAAP